MSECPRQIVDLVERFDRNREQYLSAAYNEAQVRREFIEPLFKALGWDVDNEQGLAEAYKDVIHEDAIKVGGVTKAPDYCFRIGGTRKFFVEAKKPGVALDRDPEPAYQLRRYAWTSKLPLSILTDFEEFAVYDCRVRPHRDDPASAARVFYCTCRQYAEKWPWIAEHLSKDAVLKGAFDRYAESARRKRGTAEVDEAFLAEIEGWRKRLAANFALRNPALSVRDLNFAVQRTVDRIIFLRLCEDRGIEPYGQLLALLNGDRVYERLGELFRRADERYNSSLFYFSPERGREPPDELTLSLKLDDKVLKDIIRGLYYPDCPYEFSVLPPEILGQVYERFLGKVIRLTPGHRAKVEDKPEVRKAGGVYYTPKYIVDYIVQHTVGKLLEGKTPAEICSAPVSAPRGRRRTLRHGRVAGWPLPDGRGSDYGAGRPLRILDPACGSGSFLLGAYQYLLDWYRDAYVKQIPPGGRIPPALIDRIYQGPGGQWRLTIREKKRILLNHIYGVDIDPQAVEVTKLSLLLKVLEGETSESIDSMLRLFHERALPDLDKNIKCGNSLIGPDFYEGRQLSMFDEEERLRINAFDWHREFPEVFQTHAPAQSRARKEAERRRAPEQSRDREGAEFGAEPTRDRKGAEFGAEPTRAPQQSRDREGAEFGAEQSRARKEAAKGIGARKEAAQRRASASLPEAHPLPDGRGSDPTTAPDAGFDVVIGNPPYGGFFSNEERAYCQRQYRCFRAYGDSYVAFLERGLRLLRHGGHLGMIVPSALLGGPAYTDVRRHLLNAALWSYVILLPYDVFAGAYIDTCILCLRRTARPPDQCALTYQFPKRAKLASIDLEKTAYQSVPQSVWLGDPQCRVVVDLRAARLLARLRERCGLTLGDVTEMKRGVLPGPGSLHPTPTKRHVYRYFTGDVYRYAMRARFDQYAAFDDSLRERPRDFKWFSEPRILLRRLVSRRFRLMASLARETFVTSKNLYSILALGSVPLELALGILNSRLLSYVYLKQVTQATKDDFAQVTIEDLRGLPFPDVAATKARDQIIAFVQQVLDLHERLAAAKTPHEKTALQRQIEATDRQIDQLVYELYGLTEDEIRIVEEATQ